MENFRLKVFRAVAHHLNFTRAAEELLLTQPAVTQQIKALEDELGTSLFDRTGGHISLTTAGLCLLPYATRLKALSDEAVEAVASAAATHTGKLALGASQTIGQYLLPNFVAAFLRQNPRVSVTVVSGNTDEMLMAVAERHVQLALIEGPALRKGLHVEPFMEDQMVLVIPAQHRWAEQKIEVESLKQVPILMREVGSGSRRVVENALSKAGLKKKDLISTMEFDSTEGLLSAVEAGLGVTFVSRWAVRNHLALKTLSLAHVNGLKLSRKFSLVYPSGPQLAGNAGAFYQFVLAHAGAGKLKRGGSKILSL